MNGFPYIYPPRSHVPTISDDLGPSKVTMELRKKHRAWWFPPLATFRHGTANSPRKRHAEVYPLRPAALGVSSVAVRSPAAPAQAASVVALVASLMRPRRMARPRDQWNLEEKKGKNHWWSPDFLLTLGVFFWSKSKSTTSQVSAGITDHWWFASGGLSAVFECVRIRRSIKSWNYYSINYYHKNYHKN